MQRKISLLFAMVLGMSSFLASVSFGQLRDVKWEPWQTMPCFQGISVSVLNMGYGKEAGGYLWGIRIRNDYNTPVRVNYKLTIGEENKVPTGFMTSGLLKKGDVWTDGGDVFTANLYKSSSKEYFVALDKVCFDGFKCGGNDECYADCDVVAGKPNQQCGSGGNASGKNKSSYSIETGIWTAVNSGLNIKLVSLDEGILFTDNKENDFPRIFKMVSPNHYRTRYSGDTSNHADIIFSGQQKMDYYIFNHFQRQYKYASPFTAERSDWVEDDYNNVKKTIIKIDNGLFEFDDRSQVVFYYTKTGEREFKNKYGFVYEFIGDDKLHFLTAKNTKGSYYHKVKKQNKKSFAGKVSSNAGDCTWQSERDNQKFKLKIAADGIYTAAMDGNFSSTPTWPSAGNGTYVARSGHSTYTLSFVNEKRYGISVNGNTPDYYNCITGFENADDWVNTKDKYTAKFIEQEGGVLFNGSGYIVFYPSIGKDIYQTSDRPCNPDCYKTIIRMTGKNSFSVDYTNLQGVVNRTDDYVRRSK